DQVAKQALVFLVRAGDEQRIGKLGGELNLEGVLGMYGRNFPVHVEDFAFIQPEALDYILISVSVQRFLKTLPEEILAALGVSDVAVNRQHQIVGDERISRREKSKISLDNFALVVRQSFWIFPERDVAAHADFLRHPVIGASVQILLPGP